MTMKAIWKFELDITDWQIVSVPKDARFLPTVKCGDDSIFVWAIVDPHAWATQRLIHVVGTGNPIPEGPVNYIGTGFQSFFVWHVFESTRAGIPFESSGQPDAGSSA